MGNSDGRTSCEFIVSSSHHIHFIMASFNALTTFSLLVLAIIAIALCSGAHAGTGDSGTGDSVKMMLTRRRDAEDFNHHRVKRRLNKEHLREECCERTCTFEERAEFSEDWSWHWVGRHMCELSIAEGRVCRCKARAGYIYECNSGSVPCKIKPVDDSIWSKTKIGGERHWRLYDFK